MAFKRRGARVRTRVKRNVTWATPSIILDQNVLGSANLSAPILLDADWDALITYERVKLLRVRGWLAVGQNPSAATAGCLFVSIFKMPQAVTPPNPTLSAAYDLTDLLWSGGAQFQASAATAGQLSQMFVVDVQTQRNMDPEDQIVAVFRCSPAGANCRVSGMLRALWEYK